MVKRIRKLIFSIFKKVKKYRGQRRLGPFKSSTFFLTCPPHIIWADNPTVILREAFGNPICLACSGGHHLRAGPVPILADKIFFETLWSDFSFETLWTFFFSDDLWSILFSGDAMYEFFALPPQMINGQPLI